MAVWVIVRELRASGVLGRRLGRRAAPAASSVPAAPSPAHGPGNLAELEQAPLAERSMLLLRLLVQALLRSGRLSHERTLTYRELEAHGAFDDTRQRRRFAHLAQLAERERYGARPLQSDEWPAIAREGGALYAQLLLPRRPGQAGAAPRAGAALEPRGCP